MWQSFKNKFSKSTWKKKKHHTASTVSTFNSSMFLVRLMGEQNYEWAIAPLGDTAAKAVFDQGKVVLLQIAHPWEDRLDEIFKSLNLKPGSVEVELLGSVPDDFFWH